MQFDLAPDWRVFGFALAAVLTGLLFGIAPARRAWKVDPAAALKGQAGSASTRRWSTRDILLPIQGALCCLLLTASLMAVRGLVRSVNAQLGFNPDGVTVISYNLGLAGYPLDKGVPFQRRAAEAVAQLPGVESVAYASGLPLTLDHGNNIVYSEGTIDFRPRNAFASPGFVFPRAIFIPRGRGCLRAGSLRRRTFMESRSWQL